MGTKKFKKKVKVKRVGKLVKLKKCRLNGKNHSPDIDECQSLETFSQIRDNYFSYLQNVVKENFESVDRETLSNADLERISLEVEQQALLACMQSDIYQKTMIKIIHDIRKSTQKMKLHLGIRDVIKSNNLVTKEVLARLKSEEGESIYETTKERTIEVYSQIPTISCTRTNYNGYEQSWASDGVVSEYNDMGITPVNNFSCDNNMLEQTHHNINVSATCEAQDIMETGYPCDSEHFLSLYNCNSLSSNPTEKPNVNGNVSASNSEQNNIYFPQNLVPLTLNTDESHSHNGILSDSEFTTESQVVDPILKSRNQLQKSVENSLKSLKEIKVQRKEEIERAKLVRLLEDDFDDEADDNNYDSLSDNFDETAPETNGNDDRCDLFADRLEEMRQIFGMEDEEQVEDQEEEEERDRKVIEECTNNINISRLRKPCRPQKPNKSNHTWYHERIIQMHRYSMLASEMTEDMRNINRRIFLGFFGEDSDEENEENFKREDKYITSCEERISSWVVKYLMPFYHKKKIIGRSVFKSLGHHVSTSIIDRIKYPDEWTVKYLVTKFFPTNKIFIDESDVSNFRIE